MTTISARQEVLTSRIHQSLGTEPADLVIKNVALLNVVTGETDITDIAITGNTIVGTYQYYRGKKEIDGSGLTAVPGFIDTHVHVESSLITPLEFDRCVLPHGTTTAICDPHEMANVLGVPALKYFQESSDHAIMDLMVQLSSCVPASPLETSGATIKAEELNALRHHRKTIGLAEFMDIGGVLGMAPDTLAKLAFFSDGHIDGHMPGITGYALNALACCGIRNCHESTDLPQAVEKLRKGIQVFIRQGSVCHDLATLHELITTQNSAFLGFCTDDRKPNDIAQEGHIDHLIRTAIALGAKPSDVYRVASWSAAQGFGLHQNTAKWQARGLIAPGYQADIVLLNDPNTCDVHSVLKNGSLVTPELFKSRAEVAPIGYHSVKIREIVPEDFIVPSSDDEFTDVIGLIPGQIVTEHLRLSLPQENGERKADLENGVLKIAVIERHGNNGNIAVGFVKGFGFTEGAVASSVGHDSHNITVVGATDADMALAVNTIRMTQGGEVVVKNGKVLSVIALPIAGLMSDKSFEEVATELSGLQHTARDLNVGTSDPTMTLSFLPLCVIPALKLTNFGLVRFDPARGDRGPVLVEDQRGLRRSALPWEDSAPRVAPFPKVS